MKTIFITLGYLHWHYKKAIVSLTDIWKNFLYFISEYFSIRLLFKNFFDPWKRMNENYPKRFNFKEYIFSFLTNLIIRIVGIIMRTFLLIIGLTCYIGLALVYPLVLIIWLILPFMVVFLIGNGIFFIIS
jgi:hypothetical protein